MATRRGDVQGFSLLGSYGDLMGFHRVADDVLVRTSVRDSATTTLAMDPRARGGRVGLLVDPSWLPRELVGIADELDALGVTVAAGLSTHAHHDHLLWHPRFGDVARWASAAAVRVIQEKWAALSDALAADGDRHAEAVLSAFARVVELPKPSEGVPDRDGVLPHTEVVVHDAHAPGHAALWLPDSRVLVAGDMLSDVELPLPFDEISGTTGPASYLAGLDALAPYVAQAAVVVPGHGAPTERPWERLDADRRYLEAVLAGRLAHDGRLGNRAVAAEHARIVRRVRET